MKTISEKLVLRKKYHTYGIVPALLAIALILLILGWCLPTLKLTKAIFFFFSMIFPVLKIILLIIIWFHPLTETSRIRLAHWTDTLGKWSMLDVFVVAILIVLIKSKDIADATAGIGIYLFTAAILLSMFASTLIFTLTNHTPPANGILSRLIKKAI